MTTNVLPKSLHTVTALIAVAKLIKQGNPQSNQDAVLSALAVLGYTEEQDTYKLTLQAVAKLNKAQV